MTTKDQERKALEKIRKIVEELGEDSYVGTAFEGCFDIAEENIENDFANSAKFYIDKYYESNRKEGDWKKEKERLESIIAEKDEVIDAKNSRISDLKEHDTKMWNQYCAETYKVGDLEDKLKNQEMEIIKLKARLFDMMESCGA